MYPSGTDDSISRLVAEYSPMLLRLACTRLHSPADAEDAVQEAFLRLLTASPRFRDAQHEKAWLIRTTLHRAADIQRAAARKYSAVLYLHYYEGYSIKEIAKLLGVPAPTVGTRLARGRERLRRLIKEEIS